MWNIVIFWPLKNTTYQLRDSWKILNFKEKLLLYLGQKIFNLNFISLARSANKFPSDHGTQWWAGKQLKYCLNFKVMVFSGKK